MTVSTAREINGHTAGITSDEQDLQVPARAKRRHYAATYKLAILAEYDQCDREGKGALLRREQLYTSLLSEWRKQRDRGALEGSRPPRGVNRSMPAIGRSPSSPPSVTGWLASSIGAGGWWRCREKLSALLEDLSAESASNDTERRR